MCYGEDYRHTYIQGKDTYIDLAGAILKQAKKDYIQALIDYETGDFYEITTIRKLEDFFLSDWGQFLSFNQGEYIIRKSQKIAKQMLLKPRKNASRRHVIK